MASIGEIAQTLRSIAAAGMKPKELLAAVRKQHPEATKKEVVRAAFYALIEGQGLSPEHMKELHGFAIEERTAEDEPKAARRPLRKRKKHRAGPDDGLRTH